ncbi:MAG: helix-turn-helix transcriptional regulator [Mameliella sp.]|nr:helix-turn-helix transcriptional regulator [Phaeodactylibacter sp.]
MNLRKILKLQQSPSLINDLSIKLSQVNLCDLLKQETGKSAIEHIHYHLIEKAKNQLLNSSESISEIAYDLGFEQSQNFSKLFKKKIGTSPTKYQNLN